MPKSTIDPLAQIPTGLIAMVKANAAQDADDVAAAIRLAALRYSEKFPNRRPVNLPREALLGIRIAMQFLRWEQSGVPIHLAFGLPSSTEVMRFVTTQMQGRKLGKFISVLSTAVTQIVSECLLWSSPESKDRVEMVIAGTTNEEVLVDAVAELVLQVAFRRTAGK